MVDIKLKQLKCKKCGHAWNPRKSVVYQCPYCQSCKWNEDKDVKEGL